MAPKLEFEEVASGSAKRGAVAHQSAAVARTAAAPVVARAAASPVVDVAVAADAAVAVMSRPCRMRLRRTR